MSIAASSRVPRLEPAGTAVVGPPRRSLPARIAGTLGGTIVTVFVVVVAALWVVPTFGLLVESLRGQTDNSATGWWQAIVHPGQFTGENYVSIFKNGDIMHALWNTVLITVPATVLVVVIGSMAAYALAWVDFKGRDWVFIIIVALIIVPIQVAIIPDARIYGSLGIYGSILGVILFHVAFGLPFAIFLLRNFFIGIPRDLLEAARMDGGTEFSIFRKVVLPIGWPAIASLAIYQFMWVWNDLLVALIVLGGNPDKAPLTVAVANLVNSFGSNNFQVLTSAAFISMALPLVVFFSLQRYFVRGILAGSVKG